MDTDTVMLMDEPVLAREGGNSKLLLTLSSIGQDPDGEFHLLSVDEAKANLQSLKDAGHLSKTSSSLILLALDKLYDENSDPPSGDDELSDMDMDKPDVEGVESGASTMTPYQVAKKELGDVLEPLTSAWKGHLVESMNREGSTILIDSNTARNAYQFLTSSRELQLDMGDCIVQFRPPLSIDNMAKYYPWSHSTGVSTTRSAFKDATKTPLGLLKVKEDSTGTPSILWMTSRTAEPRINKSAPRLTLTSGDQASVIALASEPVLPSDENTADLPRFNNSPRRTLTDTFRQREFDVVLSALSGMDNVLDEQEVRKTIESTVANLYATSFDPSVDTMDSEAARKRKLLGKRRGAVDRFSFTLYHK